MGWGWSWVVVLYLGTPVTWHNIITTHNHPQPQGIIITLCHTLQQPGEAVDGKCNQRNCDGNVKCWEASLLQ